MKLLLSSTLHVSILFAQSVLFPIDNLRKRFQIDQFPFFFFLMVRSSHQRRSIKKVFLKISQNSQENSCVGDPFLIQLQACNFIKKRLRHRCFPVYLAKFLRVPFSPDDCFCVLIIYIRIFMLSHCRSDNMSLQNSSDKNPWQHYLLRDSIKF